MRDSRSGEAIHGEDDEALDLRAETAVAAKVGRASTPSSRRRFAFSCATARAASPRSASPRRPASASIALRSTSRTRRRCSSGSRPTSGRRPGACSRRSLADGRIAPRERLRRAVLAFFRSERQEAALRAALDAQARPSGTRPRRAPTSRRRSEPRRLRLRLLLGRRPRCGVRRRLLKTSMSAIAERITSEGRGRAEVDAWAKASAAMYCAWLDTLATPARGPERDPEGPSRAGERGADGWRRGHSLHFPGSGGGRLLALSHRPGAPVTLPAPRSHEPIHPAPGLPRAARPRPSHRRCPRGPGSSRALGRGRAPRRPAPAPGGRRNRLRGGRGGPARARLRPRALRARVRVGEPVEDGAGVSTVLTRALKN